MGQVISTLGLRDGPSSYNNSSAKMPILMHEFVLLCWIRRGIKSPKYKIMFAQMRFFFGHEVTKLCATKKQQAKVKIALRAVVITCRETWRTQHTPQRPSRPGSSSHIFLSVYHAVFLSSHVFADQII